MMKVNIPEFLYLYLMCLCLIFLCLCVCFYVPVFMCLSLCVCVEMSAATPEFIYLLVFLCSMLLSVVVCLSTVLLV